MLFVFMFHLSFAQTFVPMLETGNGWGVDIYEDPFDPPNPPNPQTLHFTYNVGDIEIVNSTNYYRIYENSSPACLLREDNGKVYWYDENNSQEKIVFDFTLEVGDTFPIINSAYDSWGFCSNYAVEGWEDLTVQSVDYQQIAGEQRKVITFDQWGSFGNFQWIEGIGSNNGFVLLWEMVDITDGSLLTCFTNNSGIYYFNGATSCVLGIEDFNQNTGIIYPNPVHDTSTLIFPAESNINTIKIYTILGELITTERIENDTFIINKNNYAPGLYIFQAFKDSKLIEINKFIVK